MERKSWQRFAGRLTDRQFRRYFRMSKICFQVLCDEIEDLVGVDEFKSETYLNRLRRTQQYPNGSRNIIIAHDRSTGGMLSGEVKLALTLRLLGGGTYLDMALLFDVSFNHVHKIVRNVISNWLLNESFYPIRGVQYCEDDEKMKSMALQFSAASNGVINGCIGAIDGWVVKIQKPSRSDGVINPQSFYSRKGYYAVNVQAIVDKNKKILFRSIMSRGAEHNSSAFKNSSLYKWLIANWVKLAEKGYYFIGDSAYALKSFLLTPYNNAEHGTAEDNFNFFHSSSRIAVECCFGEIDLRWGILWRVLSYSLQMNCKIIDACMRLHNFLVDNRNEEIFLTS